MATKQSQLNSNGRDRRVVNDPSYTGPERRSGERRSATRIDLKLSGMLGSQRPGRTS